jgi:hypothetical protein
MFNFGKKKPDIKQYAIIGIALSSIIITLSQCTGVSQDGLWNLLDEIQRKYFPQTVLNEFILKDSKKLNRRIIRDVDNAINNVIPEYERIIKEEDKKYKPKYIEEKNDESLCYSNECKALSPSMRIYSHWIENDI